jgi:hypothetical protein
MDITWSPFTIRLKIYNGIWVEILKSYVLFGEG